MKLVYCNTVLFQEDIITLKEKTHESNVKDAIAKAVKHYLICGELQDDGQK